MNRVKENNIVKTLASGYLLHHRHGIGSIVNQDFNWLRLNPGHEGLRYVRQYDLLAYQPATHLVGLSAGWIALNPQLTTPLRFEPPLGAVGRLYAGPGFEKGNIHIADLGLYRKDVGPFITSQNFVG